ncbi:THO2 plays a role in transcriptional elongation, partial [Linderina macrospora]
MAIARALVSKKVVSRKSAQQRWEDGMLSAAEVVKDIEKYETQRNRMNTAMCYKQTKFNLVREDSEGFSKLMMVVMGGSMKVPQAQITPEILARLDSGSDRLGPRSLVAIRGIPVLQECVAEVLRNISRVIGQFRLDPNRVLDILLDCFTTSVRHSWAFFLALLDTSWWRRSDKLVQLVGWRFQLAASAAKGTWPLDELVTVAALLISHDFISLSDLYPYLLPSLDSSETTPKEDPAEVAKKRTMKRETQFSAEFQAWCDSRKDSQSSSLNALASMGALEGDGSSDAGDDEGDVEAEKTAEPEVNLDALLCAKLLAVGDADNALVYLKKFPNLARVHPQIGDIIVRMIDAVTRPVYEATDCVRLPMRNRIRVRGSVPNKPEP